MTGPANYGISNSSDVLISRLKDGTDLNSIWDDLSESMALWNSKRSAIASLLSYQTINTADAVAQNLSVPSFEKATEHGLPKAAATPAEVLLCGFTFNDYDLRINSTWRFLREADRRHIDAIFNSALSADNKLVSGTILRRLFNTTPARNEFGHVCYSLYCADAMVPPPVAGVEFDGTATHYFASQSAVLDSGDISDAVDLIRGKGYGLGNGSHIVVFANPVESKLITQWRAGVVSANGMISPWDFIPSQAAFPYLTDKAIIGQLAPTDFNGLEILGSYGPTWVTESNWIPKNYVLVAATSGPNSENNAVGMRVHPLPEWQGLKLLPGSQAGYPLIDSALARGFGVGVRHRGSAVAIQVTANTTYTKPADSSIPV